jgi:hypothetical protein
MTKRERVFPIILAAMLSAAASSLEAQQPAPRPVVREQTVYVPYERLDAVFEKEGRGIFLPYEEFLKLWEATQPKPPPPPPDTPPAAAVIRAGAYSGAILGELARFEVTYGAEALGDGWSELELPLREVAVEAVKLSDPQAVLAARGAGYVLFLPRKGRHEVELTFSARVQSAPGRKSLSFGIPPAAVSRLDILIPEEDARVEVKPLMAAARASAEGKGTRLLAFAGNAAEVTIAWMPPPGRTSSEAAVLLAEQTLRAFLGERTLRLSSQVDYQVVRGEAGSFRLRLPPAMRLLAVKGDDIREWRLGGETAPDLLEVELHSPAKESYALTLTFEQLLPEAVELPRLPLPAPRAEGVLRETGWLALGHDPALKVRVASASGLSQLDPEEMPERLRGELRAGFRYLAPPPPLELEVERLVPVVRSSTTSVIVLGRERDIWAGAIDYSITKAGLFRLELRVPEAWRVEEIGEPSTVEDHQTSAPEGGLRTITVNLKGRALGSFRLPFRLSAAPGSAAEAAYGCRPPHVAGSEDDRGILGIAAPRSLELTTRERAGMSSTDVQELVRSGILAQVSAEAGTPLAYTYRGHTPASPASLQLALSPRQEEINVLAQHLVEVADDRIRYTHFLDFEVLYREVESLQISAPSALAESLKIESLNVKERRTPVEGAGGLSTWELVLQGPTTGSIAITASHEQELKAFAAGRPQELVVPLVRPAGSIKSERGFVAIRKEGALEIEPRPQAMETITSIQLPDKLRRAQVQAALRYFEPEPHLSLALTRFDYEALAPAIVNLLHLESVLSEDPLKLTTRATLVVQNSGRQFLELELPEKSTVFTLLVAGRSEQPKKRSAEGGGTLHLVSIPRSAAPGASFPVELVYEEAIGSAMGSFGSIGLETLKVLGGVLVQKIELDLHLPPDRTYLTFRGNLKRDAGSLPSLWSRYLTTSGAAAAGHPPPASAAPPSEGALRIHLPVQGLARYSFEALAPRGSLRLTYLSPSLYFFLLPLAAAVIFGAGLLLCRRLPARKTRIALAALLLPLAAAWFSSDTLAVLFLAAAAGGAALLLALLWPAARRRYEEWRAARWALAPDPFLEEAPAKKPENGKKPAKGEKA